LQAVQLTFFYFLPNILLSGFMFPFAGMPTWAQWIGNVLPMTYFNRMIRSIMLKGSGWIELWPNVWPVAAVHGDRDDYCRALLQAHARLKGDRHARDPTLIDVRRRAARWPAARSARISARPMRPTRATRARSLNALTRRLSHAIAGGRRRAGAMVDAVPQSAARRDHPRGAGQQPDADASAGQAARGAGESRPRTGATRFPQVDANFNATRQQVNLQSVGITQFPSPGPFTLYNASVQVSYALDLFGGQRRELEGLQAAVDYQRYEFEAARLSLAANVATAAIREAGLRAQLADTVAMADAQKRQLGIMQQRFGQGGVARVDVQRQQAELAQTQALIPGLSQQIDATRHQLAVYTGQTPAAAQLPEFRLEDMQLPETLPVSLPSELARRRPIFGRQKHCSIRPRRISAWPRPTSIRRSR
jgi:hypothetical protein